MRFHLEDNGFGRAETVPIETKAKAKPRLAPKIRRVSIRPLIPTEPKIRFDRLECSSDDKLRAQF